MSHNTENIFKAYNRGMPIGTAYGAGMRDQNAKDKARRLHKSYGAHVRKEESWTAEDKARTESVRRDQSEDRKLPPYLLAYQDGPLHKGYYVMRRSDGARITGLYFSASKADEAVNASNAE